MNWDTLTHLAEALPLFYFLWRILAKLTRLLDIFTEYPPHRHVTGQLLYPKGYAPGLREKANGQASEY